MTIFAETDQKSRPRVLLVCSAGGHLLQLYSLLPSVWSHYDRSWVCLRKADSVTLLAEERVRWAYGPTNRNYVNLFRNLGLSISTILHEKPTCIVSTGAGLAIPFMIVGRLFGIKTIYIESFARSRSLSVTGKAMYRFARPFIVQSAELAERFPLSIYLGTIY